MSWSKKSLLIPAVVGQASAAMAACPQGEIWSSKGDPKANHPTVVVYPFGPQSTSSTMVFEGWVGDVLQYRVIGQVACSNGIVVCGVDIPLSDGETVSAEEILIENDQGEPEYLVYATLSDATYRLQTRSETPPEIVATWYVPQTTGTDREMIVLPTYYRFRGCAKGNEIEAGAREPSAVPRADSLAALEGLKAGSSYVAARVALFHAGWRPETKTVEPASAKCPTDASYCTATPEIVACDSSNACTVKLANAWGDTATFKLDGPPNLGTLGSWSKEAAP